VRVRAWRSFDGPNVHCLRPVLECLVDLQEWDEVLSAHIDGFGPGLVALLPGLGDHHCGLGRAGGFATRLTEGTLLGHVVEHVALELIYRAGEPVRYGKTRFAGEPRLYRIVVEQRTPELAHDAVLASIELVEALAGQGSPDLGALERRLRDTSLRRALGPSTAAIVEAALRRGVPVRRLGVGSFVQLGHGRHARLVEASVTSEARAVAVDAAQDKVLTRTLVATAGVPVAPGIAVDSADEAAQALAVLGAPMVVKPRYGHQGVGVTLDVATSLQAEAAFARAAMPGAGDASVLCERQVDGQVVRILVVGGRAVAAAVRAPASVVGDGVSTVAQLVAVENARAERGEAHERPLTRIRLDGDEATATLAAQGLEAHSVPARGQAVALGRTANLSTGGTAADMTDRLHPDAARLAERAALAVGLDVAGVDMVLPDPAASPRGGAFVLEVNAAPGLRMHLAPSTGRPRPVADAIVRHLFGRGDGRIPIAAVTGTNGKTTVARLIAHILDQTGLTVGLATTDGVRVGPELLKTGDEAGPGAARMLLADRRVDAAVLECARGGIRRRGLGFDRCTVAAVLNVGADHLGQDGVETLDDLARVKSLVVECVAPSGAAVLNARDPRVRAMADRCPGRVVLFSTREGDAHVAAHVRDGGEAVGLLDGRIVHIAGGRAHPVVALRRLAFAFGGASAAMVENACAAAAVALSLGVSHDVVSAALRTFAGGARDNPGRMNLLAVGGVRLLLDYGHNAPAVAAAAALGRRLGAAALIGVVCSPGDRRDEDIQALGETAARVFDQVWVKEDRDRRGRAPGEVAAHIAAGARRAGILEGALHVAPDEGEAVRAAIDAAGGSDIVVYFYESYDAARVILADLADERRAERLGEVVPVG